MSSAPFFVGIGAQKGGTTWLGKYFTSHSQVGFSPIKELHYFDGKYRRDLSPRHRLNKDERAFRWHVERLGKMIEKAGELPTPSEFEKIRCRSLRLEMMFDENRYVDYFDYLRGDGIATVGEITPAYAMLRANGFEAIKRLFPDAKVLFSLRDPMARFWSQLRMHETRRGKTEFSAEAMLDAAIEDPQYTLRTDYGRTLTELYKVFDKEAVSVLFFEHLMNPDSHSDELGRVNDFLGISHQPSSLEKRVNASKQIPIDPDIQTAIVRKFAPVYETIFESFGDRVPDVWRENYALIDT